jgi:hypothetical protein
MCVIAYRGDDTGPVISTIQPVESWVVRDRVCSRRAERPRASDSSVVEPVDFGAHWRSAAHPFHSRPGRREANSLVRPDRHPDHLSDHGCGVSDGV